MTREARVSDERVTTKRVSGKRASEPNDCRARPAAARDPQPRASSSPSSRGLPSLVPVCRCVCRVGAGGKTTPRAWSCVVCLDAHDAPSPVVLFTSRAAARLPSLLLPPLVSSRLVSSRSSLALPDAARLHAHVVVLWHRRPLGLARAALGRRVHRADEHAARHHDEVAPRREARERAARGAVRFGSVRNIDPRRIISSPHRRRSRETGAPCRAARKDRASSSSSS